MHRIFLPSLHKPAPPEGAGGPDAAALALSLAQLIRTHPAQRRAELVWDAEVARVAQLRHQDMFDHAYLAHDRDGVGPNEFLQQHGVRVPAEYPGGTANSVESLRLGPRDLDDCLAALLASPGHRTHILGEHDFFRGQTRIGVGVGPSWDHLQTIWVVMTVHPTE